MELFSVLVSITGTSIDALGVLVIVVGAFLSTMKFLLARGLRSYTTYRRELGRAILLGLEFLVAGDIIRTVVVSPTMEKVLVLGVIVLIRTFLSMAMEYELEGHFPWQKSEAGQK